MERVTAWLPQRDFEDELPSAARLLTSNVTNSTSRGRPAPSLGLARVLLSDSLEMFDLKSHKVSPRAQLSDFARLPLARQARARRGTAADGRGGEAREVPPALSERSRRGCAALPAARLKRRPRPHTGLYTRKATLSSLGAGWGEAAGRSTLNFGSGGFSLLGRVLGVAVQSSPSLRV